MDQPGAGGGSSAWNGVRMPVSRDADGWSDVTPASGDRIIYVSNAGSDSNDGLSTGAPKATVAAGFALVRDGTSDQVLLRRGDTFTANITINKSGRNAANPAMIGAYGTTTNARPIINGGIRLQSGSDWVFQSLDLRDNAGAVPGGVYLQSNTLGLRGARILIEDCIARDYYQAFCLTSGTGIPGGAYWNDVTIRRCTALDSDGGHGQGLFADGYGGQLTVEDFTPINCGFPDAQSHCVYIDKAVASASTPILTRILCWPNYPTTPNVSTTSEGIKSRQGAIMSDCHMAWCSIGFAIGTTDGDGSNDFVALGTVQGKIDNCIVTYACGRVAASDYGYGAWLLGIEGTGNYLRNCGFVSTLSTSNDRAFLSLIRWNAAATGGQIDNLSMTGNVSYNAGKFVVGDLPSNYSNLTFSNNKIRVSTSFFPLCEHYQDTSTTAIFTERQGNSFWSGERQTSRWISAPSPGDTLTAYGAVNAGSAGAGLPDPARTYTGYLATKSVTVANESAAHAHIRTALIAQRRYAWDANYTATALNDWFRAGLGIDTLGGVVTPTVTAPSYYLETIGAR